MNIEKLTLGVSSGDRRALAQAITLVESSRSEHRRMAVALLEALRPLGRQALRIGLSGAPGVGKSTFIEAFGCLLTGARLRVAVLAVDPSSTRSGGSILGDKTRMDLLSRDPNAFIRPSPSQTHLGGVARRTREAVGLCEAAGFDIVLIETVGVGQSETVVAHISDLFILLLAPAGGDELQGVKRGIMEIADLVLVNKADGDMLASATRTCADYSSALRLLRKRAQDPDGFPKSRLVSALTHEGLLEAWGDMKFLSEWRRSAGHFTARRATQGRYWFEEKVREGLLTGLLQGATGSALERLGRAVENGSVTPDAAAQEILSAVLAQGAAKA